ncbi:hypothetical protein GobsT_08910 [Gemmata obscuriglobus]|uniref:DUF1501 domain-containing protein n=1 Tax=Gemmata obscuriglobus TaxID=114 RepID=A0A2Z3H493_9BACT|nr:DUF1501 domain-containing protein [Gemmata obscuriglobus]AWM40588.1 DUF1501 domain-containing protein [Gemmata obscuriglobus]QEG26152.1 hypothetical protein GobsT_08910 [Gemmata obscuriglobus]VTS00739.1 arylsulfatase a family protein : Arylsulfatase A family protein OS=Singulisphaera acidiphila (strain ATCC BAA-1392 / DSM 18658 / VKM B-2454 / MOB10) GN=Sinac_4861 PE=4 SV=1: DUF1501 [Gemmata obscuriglobus UQM 2246]
MLRVLGSKKVFCDGLTRRDLLHVGALAPLGLSLEGWSRAAAPEPANPTANGFGSAKRCVLLYLWGSPSQIDTFDPKPDAPAEVRGPLGSIQTALPGVRVGEIFPKLARQLDRVTVLRSLTHNSPIHGTAFAFTGVPTTDLPLEGNVRDPRHWPFIGSVVDYLGAKDDPRPAVPRNYWLPFPFGSKRGPSRPGPFGGFLGPAYDTVWAEFRASGTREIERDSGDPGNPKKVVADPYAGIRPTDRFESVKPDDAITLDRLNDRTSLLDQLDAARRVADSRSEDTPFDRHRAMARTVLVSSKLRDALDVQREPEKVRDRYGMTLFGQSCLAARRVLEAGGKFVTVCWDEYGLVNTGWDTHVHQTPRLKDELGPGLDTALTALLGDLEARGMLADTAVVVMSEHGRTPRVQNVAGGGRDHWAGAYSGLFAGAGFAQGRVVGKTDRIGGTVAETPFSPKDVVATLFHVLGIDPQAEIHDRVGRPYAIGGVGRVRSELLA